MSQDANNHSLPPQKQKALIDVIVNRLNPRHRKRIITIPEEVIPRRLFDNQNLKKLFIRDNLRGLKLNSDDFPSCDTGNPTIDTDAEQTLHITPDLPLGSIHTITQIDATTLAVGDDDKVLLLDLTDPANPKALGSYETGARVFAVAPIGETLLAVGGDDEKVTLLDLTDSANPKALGSYETGETVLAVAPIGETLLAVGGGDEKVTLLELRDPKHPKRISWCMLLENGIYEILNDREWIFGNPNGWRYGDDPLLYRYARLYDPEAQRLVPYYCLNENRCKLSEDGKRLVIKR